jgi:hypothetical protein
MSITPQLPQSFEESFKRERPKGKIHSKQFLDAKKIIKIYGLCYQKSWSTIEVTFSMQMVKIPCFLKFVQLNPQ